MRKILLFLGVLILTLGLTVGIDGATLHTVIDDNSITYQDELGNVIMTIDDDDGVTIPVYVIGSTYSSMSITSSTDATSITTGSITTLGGASIADRLWLGDDIDMTTNTSTIYEIVLKNSQADALSITNEGSPDIMVFNTSAPSVTIIPATTITGLLTATGGITAGAAITVGTDGSGFDVTFYGTNSGSDFVWDESGDTDGSLTLGSSGGTYPVDFRVYGETNTNYLHWDGSVDDLLLVGTATQLVIAGTTDASSYADGSLRTAGGLGVAKKAYIKGLLEVGANAAGTDFKVFGVTTGHLVWWDASADSDAGTLFIGANDLGSDVYMYGASTGIYWKWDQGSDTTTTTAGAVIAPIGAGTLIDFQLDTEWVSGTIINADFSGSDTLLSGATYGIVLDFTGVNIDSDQSIKLVDLTFPNLTFDAVSKGLVGVEITGDTITQTSSGDSTWTGVDITIPTLAESAGTLTGTGVKITGGTLTSDPISYGLHVSGAFTTAISISGTLASASAIAIKSSVIINNCAFSDGYGTNEFQLEVTGTGTGHIAAASVWVNIPSGTQGAGGSFIVPLTVGVWEDGAATIAGSSITFGMHMQLQITDTDAARVCPFSINVAGDTIDAIWNAGSPSAYLGYSASTSDGESGKVPFLIDSNGRVWYIRLYDS